MDEDPDAARGVVEDVDVDGADGGVGAQRAAVGGAGVAVEGEEDDGQLHVERQLAHVVVHVGVGGDGGEGDEGEAAAVGVLEVAEGVDDVVGGGGAPAQEVALRGLVGGEEGGGVADEGGQVEEVDAGGAGEGGVEEGDEGRGVLLVVGAGQGAELVGRAAVALDGAALAGAKEVLGGVVEELEERGRDAAHHHH